MIRINKYKLGAIRSLLDAEITLRREGNHEYTYNLRVH